MDQTLFQRLQNDPALRAKFTKDVAAMQKVVDEVEQNESNISKPQPELAILDVINALRCVVTRVFNYLTHSASAG